jgi:hypothetical protein
MRFPWTPAAVLLGGAHDLVAGTKSWWNAKSWRGASDMVMAVSATSAVP